MPAPVYGPIHLQLANALERLPIGIAATAPSGSIEYASPHFRRLLGWADDQPVGFDVAQLRVGAPARLRVDIKAALLAGDVWQGETRLQTDRGIRHVLESAYPELDEGGRLVRVIHFFHELSRLREIDALARLAFHDATTGLPNRSLFEDRLIAAIAVARRNRKVLAVIHTDVEHFNRVNLVLDRRAGDDLLRHITRRIEHALRASDSVARFTAGEFAILLPEVGGAGEALATGEKVRRACTGWYEADGRECSVTLSIGVSVLDAGDTAPSLLARAEAALYRDQAARRDSHALHARFTGTRYPLDRE